MKKLILYIGLFSLLFSYIPNVFAAEDLTPNAKSAILIEASTGKVLYKKNENEELAPASMTKIMSMILVMEALENEE